MKKTLTTLLFVLITCSAFSQLYKYHDWEENPVFTELNSEENELASVAVKEKYLIQYYATVLGNTIRLFETKHSIIRVNTDKGINKHNRVYIPMRDVKKVIDIKARVLQQDGSIKYLNKNNIKELKNVKEYGNFKIFALEGVTSNCQLEFIYTLERHTSSLGAVIVQKDYRVKEAEVIIRKPSSLGYRIKPYNGFPEMTVKKVDGNKEALTATMENIEAMIDEESASPQANRMKVNYQVAGSFAGNDYMWNGLETGVINNYINSKPSKHKGLIKDYINFTREKSRNSNEEIINNICEYVYANYNIIRTRNEKLTDLKYIIAQKQATEQGIIKLFCCLFNHENLDYEFVLTSDRFNHKFDPSFYSHHNLQIVLFYFIEEKKYLRPDFLNERLFFAPIKTISNKGIFINAEGRRFKTIEVPRADENLISRDFEISMDEELIPTIVCDHQATGYRGDNARGAYHYFKKKDLEEYKNFTCVTGIEDAEFIDFDITNTERSLSTNNMPLKLNYSYKAESLVEDLGSDFILEFGKVIGTQNEFYQEVKRVNPVEQRSLITYNYKIRINVPNGFKPIGLEDININRVVNIDNKLACSFVSEYTFENNVIDISVSEIYNQLHMDLYYYNDYKNVVNAAFDFSKKSILFEKIEE